MGEFMPDIIRTDDAQDFADTAARLIWARITSIKNPLITFPTGKTPLDIYSRLLRDHGGDKAVWEKVRYLALDEYVGLPEGDERLFAQWLGRELLDRAGVPASNRMVFNSLAADPAQEAKRMEQWIAANGPIDIAILGLGENGHIGFNEPGSAFDSVTRQIALSPETREANARYWGSLDKVPEQAFTLGLKTLSSARHVFLLVSGAHKAAALEATLHGPLTPDVPATVLRTLPNVTIIADKAALGLK